MIFRPVILRLMTDEIHNPLPVITAAGQEVKQGETIFGLSVELMNFNDKSIDRMILTSEELTVLAGTSEITAAETENGEAVLETYIVSERNKTDKVSQPLVGMVKLADNSVQVFGIPRQGADSVRVPAEKAWQLLENSREKRFTVDPQKSSRLRISKQLGYAGGAYTYFVLPIA